MPRLFPVLALVFPLGLALGCAVEGAPADDDDTLSGTPTPGELAECEGEPSSDTACVTLDGARYQMPFGFGWIGSGSDDGRIRAGFGQDSVLSPPSIIFEYDRYIGPGTYNCAADGTVIVLLGPDGVTYSAFNDLAFLGASCSFTLEETGPNVGDAVTGHFEAQVWETSSGPLHTSTGRFATFLHEAE